MFFVEKKILVFLLFFESSMRSLTLTYGFNGPERQEVLQKSMIGNRDKVCLRKGIR